MNCIQVNRFLPSFLLFFLLVFVGFSGFGQISTTQPVKIEATMGGVLVLPQAVAETIGDYNLFEEKQEIIFYLKNGLSLITTETNFNLERSQFVVTEEKRVFGLQLNYIDSILVSDGQQQFINSSLVDGFPREELFKVLFRSEKVQLYKRTVVEIIDPNYNVALNVGTRDTEIRKETELYLLDVSDGTVSSFKRAKKMIASMKNADELKSFVKSKRLKFEQDDDFVTLLTYNDSLD